MYSTFLGKEMWRIFYDGRSYTVKKSTVTPGFYKKKNGIITFLNGKRKKKRVFVKHGFAITLWKPTADEYSVYKEMDGKEVDFYLHSEKEPSKCLIERVEPSEKNAKLQVIISLSTVL